MFIYLPIAETAVNPSFFVLLGVLVGFISGLFGVGGGFLMTPLLIFFGIPPAVAVATEANQVVGTSTSASIVHARRGRMDFTMAWVLLVGGIIGSVLGIWLFAHFKKAGHIDMVIALLIASLLLIIGSLMMVESWRKLTGLPMAGRTQLHRSPLLMSLRHALPMKMRFRKSHLYISAIIPIFIGFIVGILAALTGLGGGFILVPAMIYLLGMPTVLVIGTSLCYIAIVSACVTIMHASFNHSVDIVLAFLLLTGGVIGAQIGSRILVFLRGFHLRLLLAVLTLMVSFRLLWRLISQPDVPYSIARVVGG